MQNVEFTYKENRPVFSFLNKLGKQEYIDYQLKIGSDFNISLSQNYEVELLINPILNKERHHYAIRNKDIREDSPSIGVVFPVSIFDGTDEEIAPRQLDYFAIAFYELLKRLDCIKEGAFSQNFEDNICVCVFDLKQANSGSHILPKCIHSLRLYNYAYFVENNTYKPIDDFQESWYVKDIDKSIYVSLQEPPLYTEEIIDSIMRMLPTASNIIHRFSFFYQVIEFLIEVKQKEEIEEKITKYNNGNTTENDFFEDISNINKERAIIRMIFELCSLTSSDCNEFLNEVKVLYSSLSYKPKKDAPYDYFYSFRNQMTHSLRKIIKDRKSLAKIIFEFDQIIMHIISKYPYPLKN